MVSTIEFAGSRPALVREADVRSGLSLRQAIEGLAEALRDSGGEEPVSLPRLRIVPKGKDRAWLHTLRAGAGGRGIAGGKDYTSIGFDTPSLWMTVVSQRSGRLLAFIEAEHLSRLRTAAVTAVAPPISSPRRRRGRSPTSESLTDSLSVATISWWRHGTSASVGPISVATGWISMVVTRFSTLPSSPRRTHGRPTGSSASTCSAGSMDASSNTERGEDFHVLSLREATKHEARYYFEIVSDDG